MGTAALVLHAFPAYIEIISSMTCDSCDQPATVFLSQKNKDGSIHKMNLCPACAQASQAEDSTGYALAEMLTGFSEEATAVQQGDKRPANACPACGFTIAHLKKTGRLGCPDCYSIFGKSVSGMLEKMHRSAEHKGKRPQNIPEPATSLATLEDELASAVQNEDYEKAASLRDRIQKQQESATS